MNASVCGRSIKMPKSACDKYCASDVFCETKLNRNAAEEKIVSSFEYIQWKICFFECILAYMRILVIQSAAPICPIR